MSLRAWDDEAVGRFLQEWVLWGLDIRHNVSFDCRDTHKIYRARHRRTGEWALVAFDRQHGEYGVAVRLDPAIEEHGFEPPPANSRVPTLSSETACEVGRVFREMLVCNPGPSLSPARLSEAAQGIYVRMPRPDMRAPPEYRLFWYGPDGFEWRK